MTGTIVYETAVKEDLSLGTGTVTRSNPAGGQMNGHQINLSTFALIASQVWDPASVTTGIPVTTDVTVPGALPGDHAVATFDGNMDHTLQLAARVIQPDTVRVVIYNHGLVPFNPGSGTLRVLVFRIP